jgi:Amt family ammonium transporter
MYNYSNLDIIWIVLCGIFVFFTQLGFALIETGTVRSKNTINVAMKNLIDTIFGIIIFWAIGYGFMFGSDLNGLIGSSHFFIDGNDMHENAFFFFQAMFAATSITIVSGAVTERIKFNAYILVAIFVSLFIYPIFGHWSWGEGGWLNELGFKDFAGSSVVHSVGAWIGLAGAIVLGPRLGKFKNEQINNFSASNYNFIVFGIFILWFSWFGFNAGALHKFDESVTKILLNTLIAGAFGGFGGYLISLIFKDKVNIKIFSFGILSGLVSITAGCNEFNTQIAAFVGFSSAILMFIFDQIILRVLKIDDPLSIVSIHGFSGAWGTLCVGLFAPIPQNMTRFAFIEIQLLGIFTAFVFAFSMGLIFFKILCNFNLLRVSKKDEVIGLNISQHDVKLPFITTIDSMIKMVKSGDLNKKVYEEKDCEIGIIAKLFNHLLSNLQKKHLKLENSNLKLKEESITDPLTNIMNRRGFFEKIDNRNPYENEFSIIILDIDKFKSVNDTYGHSIGDDIIRNIAQIIKPMLRSDDCFARWGGEEFIIVIKTLDIEIAEKTAERLRLKIESYVFDVVGKVTCSFGVSTSKNKYIKLEEIIENADKALYQAKELGRNKVCSW